MVLARLNLEEGIASALSMEMVSMRKERREEEEELWQYAKRSRGIGCFLKRVASLVLDGELLDTVYCFIISLLFHKFLVLLGLSVTSSYPSTTSAHFKPTYL